MKNAARDPRLDDMPRMQKCENCPEVRVQRHHALEYANKQIQELYAVRALCATCHMGNSMKPTKRAALISKINAIKDGGEHLQTHYPKRNWKQEKLGAERELKKLDTVSKEW